MRGEASTFFLTGEAMQLPIALCAAMLQCTNPLVVSAAALLCPFTLPDGEQPSIPVPQSVPDSTWRLTALPDGRLRAEHRTSTEVVAPVFASVELRRLFGTMEVSCGEFPLPAVIDNGVERVWVYEMKRPASGTCAVAEGREFVAVARRGNAEVRSTPVP
jgi:hypothetical protein